MSRLYARLALLSLFTALICSDASAVVLGGSLRTSLYYQEAELSDEVLPLEQDLEERLRLLETVRLDVLDLGSPVLSFHTSLTASNYLTDESAKDTRVRLYSAYLQAAERWQKYEVDARIGRQWVMGGVANSLIDGASLRLQRRRLAQLSGYFGTLGTERIRHTRSFWSLDSPENRTYGGRLKLEPRLGPLTPRLAASYARADRKPHREFGIDAERIGLHGRLGFGTPGRGGLLSSFELWGDWRHDLMLERTYGAAGGIDFRQGPHGLMAGIEYNERRPTFRSTSLFASFGARPVRQLRGHAGLDLFAGLRADVVADLITFSGDEDEKGGQVLLSGHGLSVGYRMHDGYGGDLEGFILNGHRDLTDRLALDASINVSQYRYGEEAGVDALIVDDDEQSGVLAATWRLRDNLNLVGQVEGLINSRYDHDVRGLGSVQWRFRSVL